MENQTSTNSNKIGEEDNEGANKTSGIPSWAPQIGMRFSTLEEAWNFWEYYGGRIGFGVRKRYANPSKFDGIITSIRFVCRKEGHKKSDKRDHLSKQPRAEIRTDCPVHIGLTIDREVGNYVVFDLVLEHNHKLQLQETCHLLPSQRKISEIQAFDIENADESGIGPKAAHELASRQVGGSLNLTYTPRDHKNYLRSKRQRGLIYGEAGSMLKYFLDRTIENQSFEYAIQLDCEEQIANIFWADAKMIIDYAHFGDVVTFDTTFGTNKEYRPFGVFLGFNHFRETVVFGACLLYDETFDSFRWLFDTFLSTHNKKQPRTIYTDQDTAMGNAIKDVFTEARHGLCTFHIMQNAIKHLSAHCTKESNLIKDFRACVFGYEDKETFVEAFYTLRTKVEKQTWFDSIYKVREKWAECYMRDAFTLGMRSTQLSESLNNDLKLHLKSDLDLVRFFKHFERVVKGKRDNELNSEYESREKLPRIKITTPMLVQASEQPENEIQQQMKGRKRPTKAKKTQQQENGIKKTNKGRKKATKTTSAHDLPMGSQQHKDETHSLTEKDTGSIENDFHGYGCIKSYTELLMGSSVEQLYVNDMFLSDPFCHQ
ncbi:protein FAR1-RELATED SEQUENCE 5-like isoform X1 [Triticum dicoccoides]|uniref:protein FAR1-RELATED SEQUENCE 5-like isoform X1 n=1 Tax=Triticum dicoccoides TaxID=85692 RepID=UPI00188FFD88|nr:protein FAR1-RELATED SEQUENCE 5-like isoform X1 [Triticum dicoccoides]